MKALSIRQPWLNLILQGLKDIEVRTWQSNYRGRILLHASNTVDKSALEVFQAPKAFETGSYLGAANLIYIIRLDERNWDTLKGRHLNLWEYDPSVKHYGWVLEDVHRFENPVIGYGQLGLFNPSEKLLEKIKTKNDFSFLK